MLWRQPVGRLVVKQPVARRVKQDLVRRVARARVNAQLRKKPVYPRVPAPLEPEVEKAVFDDKLNVVLK